MGERDASAGGLLLLLAALYLLLAFFTHRLDWLIKVKDDVQDLHDAGTAPTAPAQPAVFGGNIRRPTTSGAVT